MVNWLIELSLRNRFLVIAFFALAGAWGYWALLTTPLDAIPDLSDNQVIVFTDWSGRSLLTAIAATVSLPRASADETLETRLYRRFQPSRIEIRDPAHRGEILRQGKVLILVGGAVPARPFRVTQATPAAPSRHVMEFAPVDVRADGSVRAEPGPLVLPRGSRLVVLDVKVRGDRVHLLTHSAEPLPTPWQGKLAYGCTEFTFQVPAAILAGGDAEPLFQLIERWLQWTPEERLCAPGHDQLCLEP